MSEFSWIGRAADVPYLEGRRTTVGGVRIAVFNTGTGFAAIGDECPHEGGPLADGIVADSCVTCPLHGWRIDLVTGEAVAGAAGGVSVPVFEIVEREGELYVRLETSALAA